MDPYTATVFAFATQLLRVIEQAQVSFNNAPKEYREQYYKRLAKLEALADPILDAVGQAALKWARPEVSAVNPK